MTSQQVVQFLSDARIQDMLDQVPQLRQMLGIARLDPTHAVKVEQIFIQPELRHIALLAQERHWLSGWEILRGVVESQSLFRLTLLLALVTTALSMVCIILDHRAGLASFLRVGRVALLFGAGLCFLMLLWYIPSVDTFGWRDEFGIAFVCLLTGSRAGSGIWGTLFGLLLTLVGSATSLLLPESESPEQDAEELTYRGGYP